MTVERRAFHQPAPIGHSYNHRDLVVSHADSTVFKVRSTHLGHLRMRPEDTCTRCRWSPAGSRCQGECIACTVDTPEQAAGLTLLCQVQRHWRRGGSHEVLCQRGPDWLLDGIAGTMTSYRKGAGSPFRIHVALPVEGVPFTFSRRTL